MSIVAIIKKLRYEQKRDLCVNIICDKNIEKSKEEITEKDLEICIEEYLLKYSEEYNKDVLELWLIYIGDILDNFKINNSVLFIKNLLKNEIDSILCNLETLDNDYVNDRVEAICRNLVLLFSEGNLELDNRINIKRTIEKNLNTAMSGMIKCYTKEIKSNRWMYLESITPKFISPIYNIGIVGRLIIINQKVRVANSELKKKIKYIKIIVKLYIKSYLNKWNTVVS